MHKPPSNVGPTQESLARGYEVGDLSGKVAIGFTVGLAIFLALSFIAMAVLWHVLTMNPPGSDNLKSVVTGQAVDMTYPPLQPTQQHDRRPVEDLMTMHQNENAVFSQMGWAVDKETYETRVPDDLVAAVAAKEKTRQATFKVSTQTPPAKPVVTPVVGSDEGGAR